MNQLYQLVVSVIVAVVFAFMAGLPSVINLAPSGSMFVPAAVVGQLYASIIVAICVVPWARRVDKQRLKFVSITVLASVVAIAVVQGTAAASLRFNGIPYYALLVFTIITMILAAMIGAAISTKQKES